MINEPNDDSFSIECNKISTHAKKTPSSKNKINSKKYHQKLKFDNDEDDILTKMVEKYGTSDWNIISDQIPGKNARQCRDRWSNYLSPYVINGPWTPDEEDLLMLKYDQIGPYWRKIVKFFPTRTDINIKSHWHLIERKSKKEEIKRKKEMIIKKIDHKNDEQRKHISEPIVSYNNQTNNLPNIGLSNQETDNIVEFEFSVSKKDNLDSFDEIQSPKITSNLSESNEEKNDFMAFNDFWDNLFMKAEIMDFFDSLI